ncbi:MAG TPA: M23 family metallopeptidase [Longimicrobiaceae bacterium]|nr:M23 family metallopeptidase [Longimicrobiaceae bacterium]
MTLRRIVRAALPATALACGGPVAPAAAACSEYPPQHASEYVLPYPVGQAYRVIQGNCTAAPGASHAAGSAFPLAYDFDMAVGTAVTASRGGVVVAVEERFTDGNRVPGEENLVHVRHSDGSIGRYYHLTQGGALVETGAAVQAGDPLGLSGDTGNSRGPHLHFDVAECPQVGCRTRAVTFRNTAAHPRGLAVGGTYLAGPW